MVQAEVDHVVNPGARFGAQGVYPKILARLRQADSSFDIIQVNLGFGLETSSKPTPEVLTAGVFCHECLV